MTDDDNARKLDELDRLLNDPNVPLQPTLIWRLVHEVSEHDLQNDSIRSHRTRLAEQAVCTVVEDRISSASSNASH